MDKIIDLCGAWKMRWSDGQRGGDVARFLTADADLNTALDVTVPGEVHEELIKNGLLADTNLGLNCLAGRWVEETFWYYRRTFNIPKIQNKERIHLVFECLDLAAVIYLNGVEIGRHANYFYPCRLDVTEKLRGGENVLVVKLESGLFSTMDRSADGYGVSVDSRLTKRPWLRKTQSSFGWDWAPRLLNVGIPGDVYLEISQTVRFDRLVVLADLSDDLKTGTVTGRVFSEGLEKEPCRGRLEMEIRETRQKVSAEVEIKPGLNYNEIKINVNKPNLWWPVNHGLPNRYTIRATLSIGRRVIKTDFRKVGFRKVKIVQDKHPEGGNYFILEVNKKPIFAKGGNFVPADTIFSKIDRKRYEVLVDRALEANFNFLRVWGGGLYEKDSFYDVCDEKGVLVWQEFIFACAKYPTTDEKFLADLEMEVTHQIRRLAHHPSLVVWCGNNEMEWGNYEWGYQTGVAYPDYAFFHLVLPRILKREDPDRYYQPSSPLSPNHENPNRDDQGDQHPWSVGMFNTDFRDYRKMTCRFPNEGGMLGPTSLATVKACLPEGMERPGSFAWEIHDNSVSYWGDKSYPDLMLQQWLGKDIGSLSLEDYVYYAGLVQGEGLSEYIKNFRRRMFNSASAIFWMFNDCWPAVRSWTIVDYYLRRTPSFYPVRRAFAPLTVVVTRENNKVRVYGINEGKAWSGKVRYGLLVLSGGYPYDRTQPVVLPANTSTVIAEFDAGLWKKQKEKALTAFAILLAGDSKEVARDRLFLPFFKEMIWPKTEITVKQEGGKAIFRSKTFAWRVCLDLEGEKRLPDNFFDVFPGIPTILEWPAELGEPKVLRVGNLL